MDLISRQKAKDAIDMALDHIDHVPPWVYDNLLNALNEVPSVKPTHPTPSNTLGALDCIDRQEAIKALCREECGMDPKGCRVGTCYDVEIIEDVPSVQLELSNNSTKLDNKNGDLISRQAAIDVLNRGLSKIPYVNNTDEETIRRDERIGCIQEIRELPSVPRKGKWIDYSDEGFVECPFCHSATNCDGNKDELHYCFSCGAELRGDSDDR